MGNGKTAPDHDGRRGEGYVRRLAQQYVDHLPDSDQVALEISNALNACYNAHRAALGKVFEELGVAKTLGRSTVIRTIFFAGRPLTHNEIGTELEITPGSVTYLVDGLERDGFAKRNVDSTDRRTVYVELTPEGEEIGAQLTPAIAHFAAELCNVFSEDEKIQFRDLLFKYLMSNRQRGAAAVTREVVTPGQE